MPIQNIVFLHGWGLNSGVWVDFVARFQLVEPSIKVYLIDIAGYGTQASKLSSSDIEILAVDCLARAPEQALWVAWSLGGMIALKAAASVNNAVKPRIQALQLISTTPRFVQADDWPQGVELASFQRFCDVLSENYDQALIKFLAMQAGADKAAQKAASRAHEAICEQTAPSPETLQLGIDCLGRDNMLNQLKPLGIPTQVVCGSLDRVAHPNASNVLADKLQCELITCRTGHAPFLTQAEQTLAGLRDFIRAVNFQNSGAKI